MKYEHHLPEEDDGQRLLVSALVELVGERVVWKMTKKLPHHKEEFVSIMYHTVVTVCERKGNEITLDDHSRAYVAKAVWYALLDYVCRIPIVHASPSHSRSEFRKYGATKIVIVNEVDTNIAVDSYDEDAVLQSLAETQQEAVIIAQRLDGLTYREIGENIGLTGVRVWQITTALRRRLWR
jgi:DNA-directed RNA polymerase specialized sigma24 family protein